MIPTLIENNRYFNYQLYQLPLLEVYHQQLLHDTDTVYQRFIKEFGDKSSTFSYGSYNVFALAHGIVTYHTLCKNIQTIIKQYMQTDEPLWFRAWLNYHTPDQLLDWHNHDNCVAHGFVSIDPKQSITEFKEYNVKDSIGYSIKNSIGKLYIGPGSNYHRVVNNTTFTTPRITIAFDVYNYNNIRHALQVENADTYAKTSIFPV